MASRDDQRFIRIDRLTFGRLVSGLLSFAFGSGIALGIFVLSIDYFAEEPTWLSAASILIASGPIAAWGLFLASGELLAMAQWIGRRRTRVDLDAPEIVIPRKRPPRVLSSLGVLWFMLFIGGLTLSKFKADEIDTGSLIGAAIVLFFFVYIPAQNLWTMWRWKTRDFVPLVLDAEGLLDRSIIDRPRIPWQDIAEIELESGYITLTGDTKKWLETEVPDRRWFKSLRGQRPPTRISLRYGLQPNDYYALSLVRAYWLRRTAGDAVDQRTTPNPAVQRG
jgi:hypothetical protein